MAYAKIEKILSHSTFHSIPSLNESIRELTNHEFVQYKTTHGDNLLMVALQNPKDNSLLQECITKITTLSANDIESLLLDQNQNLKNALAIATNSLPNAYQTTQVFTLYEQCNKGERVSSGLYHHLLTLFSSCPALLDEHFFFLFIKLGLQTKNDNMFSALTSLITNSSEQQCKQLLDSLKTLPSEQLIYLLDQLNLLILFARYHPALIEELMLIIPQNARFIFIKKQQPEVGMH